MRAELEVQRVGYVLAIGCDRRIQTAAGPLRADQAAAGLPRRAWPHRLGVLLAVAAFIAAPALIIANITTL